MSLDICEVGSIGERLKANPDFFFTSPLPRERYRSLARPLLKTIHCQAKLSAPQNARLSALSLHRPTELGLRWFSKLRGL